MAFLDHIKKDGTTARFELFKRLTSIGSSDTADIRILGENLDGIEAYINQTMNKFTLVIPPDKACALVDGLQVKKHEFTKNCVFHIKNTKLAFFAQEISPTQTNQDHNLTAYRHLLEFSQRIARESDIDALLATLLKEITTLTGAEHGFLVLIENGATRVRVQESLNGNNHFDQIGPMSDSIVKKVIETKTAIIVSDALSDHEFSSSLSVINYRLSSVMCAPLFYQGHIFGAIYVGNNSFTNAFSQKNLDLMTIYSSQAALLVQNAIHINALKARTKTLQESLDLTKFGGIIGGSSGMQEIFQQVEKVAQTDVSVLIVGERGTGKELIARELHARSPRKNGPFVVINCGAIPEDLLESELFGHMRGAFSKALQSRPGKFQSAHLGTLLLDEVSEIPMHLQIKVLRALQEQKITKMGSEQAEAIDIRILAATNRDLSGLVENGLFRQDLYYRLNVVQIELPPLKDRGNDVLVIANYFLQKYTKIYSKNVAGFDEEAQNALLNYSWPGNIRQLENRMRRAVVMCEHNRITVGDLDLKAECCDKIMPLSAALDRFRNKYIDEALERNAGNRTKTASELGVDPRTIFRHIKSSKTSEESYEK